MLELIARAWAALGAVLELEGARGVLGNEGRKVLHFSPAVVPERERQQLVACYHSCPLHALLVSTAELSSSFSFIFFGGG